MRKFLLLLIISVFSFTGFSQDFSNKGKDFYLCFPHHVPSGTNAKLSIWITSDQASSGTITMANGAFSSTFNIAANGLAEVQVPYAAAFISNGESTTEFTTLILKKSIRVQVDPGKPAVVAYLQQWGNARSAATLLLPVNVLGKKYFAISANQDGANAGGQNARSQFQIIATKDNTVVTISLVKNGLKGGAFTVTLPLAGDMIQYQSPDGAAATQDITGTVIESVASGSGGCLPIAVFSGSSNLKIGTQTPNCGGGSYDPLLQQLYPVTTWGKNFGFVPLANYQNGVPYRVMAAEDNTTVFFNGAVVATLNAGQIYPAAFTTNAPTLTAPTFITADKPICVAEYAQSSGCSGQGNNQGDPDMVILNPIEQSISDITIFSTKQQVINTQWVNILIKTIATPSFKLSRNGGPLTLPASAWQPFAALPGYSYLREQLPTPAGISDSYRLVADSGFNAIAYGLGDNESYAYSAGTNVKDLTQQIELGTTYGIENTPALCVGETFNFKVYFPVPNTPTGNFDSLKWSCTSAALVPNNLPITLTGPLGPTIDSTNIRNGKPVNWYSLPGLYSFNAPGTYTVTITTYKSTTEGCGSEQDYDFTITVFNPPVPSYTYTPPACYLEPVAFEETTPQVPKLTYAWYWNFGDPASGAANIAITRSPVHTFSGPGTYSVKYVGITTTGCISDTVTQQVIVPDVPNATISSNATSVCINSAPQPQVSFNITGGLAPYVVDYSLNGVPQTPAISATNIYTINVPTTAATTFTYRLDSIKNQGSALCKNIINGQTVTVTVNPNATIAYQPGSGSISQTVCVNSSINQIDYLVGSGGTGGSFTVSPVVAGFSGSYNAVSKIYSINGAPAAAGVYTITVRPTGPCTDAAVFLTATITVNATATLALSSGNPNPTLCINTPILLPIVYDVGGGATGANVLFTPLLPGVTGTYNAVTQKVTILGTPTISGTFNFSVSTVSSCSNPPPLGGTIIVNPDATISLAVVSGPVTQAICINNSIVDINYVIDGSVTTVNVAPLPAGINFLYSPGVSGNPGTLKISGTATAATAGPLAYAVILTGPCQIPATMTGSINVTPDASISLAAGGPPTQAVCVNNNISQINYTIAGAVSSVTVTGLPAGVTYSYTPGTPTGTLSIQGTPTGAGSAYTITLTGPCQVPPAVNGTITVNPDATIALVSATATTNQTLCVNNAITDIDYTIGGSVTSVNVAALPAGITFTFTPGSPGTLKIKGTATAATAGPLNYSIIITGPCQVPAVMNGSLNVRPDATIALAGGGPATQTVCVNNPLAQINYTITGAVTAVNVTGLPAGVTYTYIPGTPSGTLTIQGTPTGAGSSAYIITVTGPCQVPAPSGGTITATAGATISLAVTGTNVQAVCINNLIVPIIYNTGGSATGVTLTGPLPPGVTMTTVGNTVTILGAPTVVSTTPVVYPYSITTVGPCPNLGAPLTGSITVNPDHTLSLNGGSNEIQTVCSGILIAPISYTFGSGATGVTVTALPPGLIATTVGNMVTITGAPTASGSYIIKTTGNNCQLAQRGGTINVVALPAGNFSLTIPSCNTRVITFTDNSVANAGTINTWAWDFGDPASIPNNTSSQANPTHTFSLPGTYTVGLTVTTQPNGCFNATPFTRLVTINERPKTDFTNPAAACVNDNAAFTDASTLPITGGTFNNAGYQWNFGDPASGAANTQFAKNGTHQFSAGGTYTVTHISVSSAGCADTITHTVNISSAPVADFAVTNTGALCVNDTVSIVNLSSIGVGTITKLEIYWDYLGAPGTFVTDNAPLLNTVYKHKYPDFQVPVTKPYTVLVRTFSGISCTNDKQTVITINAVPKVQFNAMPDVCYDAAPFQISQAGEIGGVPGSGAYTGPGVSVTGLFNPVTAGVGAHTIKYTFTSVAGCVDTMSSTIRVLETASAKFSFVNPLCEGNPVTFKEASTAPAGVVLNNTTWNFGDGSLVEQHAPGTSFTHDFIPGWGNYTVTMYTTSAFGCKSTNNVQQVYVNPNPKPDFAFVSTAAVCLPNAAVSFLNNSAIADNSAITYSWDFGDGRISSAKVPPPHVYSGARPYTVTLVVTSAAPGGGCVKQMTRIVDFIHPQPKAAFDFNKPEVCIGGDVIVTDNTNGLDGTVQQWFWNFDDGIKGNTKQVQHLYTTPKTYNVSLYIINSLGCNSDTLTQQFTVHPYPVVDAGPDGIVLEGGSYALQPIVTNSADYQYLWSPATYLNSTTTANPTANVILDDITYTLVVTGRGGCIAPSDKVFIKVLKAPRIPNTFTPNGDGINELWLIDYLDTYPNCRVQVFTRTGQLVFESKGGYKKPWDGKLNGKPLPFDTYYYIIEPGNGRTPITGYVTIIK